MSKALLMITSRHKATFDAELTESVKKSMNEAMIKMFKLQFHEHHSNFRKDFHMLSALKEGEI